ncbi:MAG TPA: type IV secretory system conjugative DNA transfer family protein [Candidatus Lumbricidophila sp.]|nr:type IV secretory system conjugative DNA transfer family protein [Candidatus Lumbricidophila sp.]
MATREKTKRAPSDPKADAWDKIAGQESHQTLANRDVFRNQQLDRSTIDAKQSKTGRTIAAAVLGAFIALVTWIVGGLVIWGFGAVVAMVDKTHKVKTPEFATTVFGFNGWIVLLALFLGFCVFGIVYTMLMRNLAAQNLMNDTTDINQYAGDQHIALPEEVVRKFDWFPDVGAHSNVQVSSMISHVMIANKGLKGVELARRADKDILDDSGEVEFLKGEVLLDSNDEPIFDKKPLIDEAFGELLFDASGLPKDKELRRKFDTTKIPYNPDGADRAKQGSHKTVADFINADWTFPEYEVQRPAGAYLVDTAPVNTMVLAITRAGKGQTYIEPVIDMWLREKRPNNMVINDPKGELLVKHYVRATMRGFQVVQFNLINPEKTDIYNPLGMAAEAAREGNVTKCAQYVENIAEVFFPLDSGDDPVWANSANNAFKRVAYGLIDYYMEEERLLRAQAERDDVLPKVLETKIDEMWGKVTLYNCYRLFTVLTGKKQKSPMTKLAADVKAGKYGNEEAGTFDSEAFGFAEELAMEREFLWNGSAELDLLSLYFNATETLPTNSIRTLIMNANNSLKSMGGAEKMLASVYGIAITAMSFFADPTIMNLTSGTPSQNVDLAGLSFPRRFGVRFSPDYLTREHLIGTQARWEAFEDIGFTKSLGTDFVHEDTVSREGWARYYFKGKFKSQTGYLKLELVNAQTKLLIKTFRFEFTKDYHTSLDGRYYVTDPVTGKKLVKNGVLIELRKDEDAGVFKPGHTMYPQLRLQTSDDSDELTKGIVDARAVMQTMVRYSESPKAVFLVTPPHLTKYAKLLLILIKQLVDLNFDQSYMTKSDQKPLYKTRFMLDELGNLQSEGHGISSFETMLSIGLGQEQQFTIILQTLQQLRDVYGESVDKIVQGNVSNIIFLKSTDDSMLDTLQKMSGTRHQVYRDSKTVTKDVERLIKFTGVEGKVSYTMSAKEEPVISYNDMAFISERNSILFRAGDAPIWNRNETILPMSWQLFKNTIVHPGHEYSLQTIPTLSSVADYDVRQNQPDFFKMMETRIEQAVKVEAAKEQYRKAFGYNEVDISRLDPDVYSDAVMDLVNSRVSEETVELESLVGDADGITWGPDPMEEYEENLEFKKSEEEAQAKRQDDALKRYAEGKISRDDLGPGLDQHVIDAFVACLPDMQASTQYFSTGADGSLRSQDGSKVFIAKTDDQKSIDAMRAQSEDVEARVFTEPEAIEQVLSHGAWRVSRDFYRFLGELPSWQGIANGEFDRLMAAFWSQKETQSLVSA